MSQSRAEDTAVQVRPKRAIPKKSLIERFRTDIALPDLRHEIAKCERRDKLGDACGLSSRETGGWSRANSSQSNNRLQDCRVPCATTLTVSFLRPASSARCRRLPGAPSRRRMCASPKWIQSSLPLPLFFLLVVPTSAVIGGGWTLLLLGGGLQLLQRAWVSGGRVGAPSAGNPDRTPDIPHTRCRVRLQVASST